MTLLKNSYVGGLRVQSSPRSLRMRISLPRHDLLGEKRLTSLSEEKGFELLSQCAFIGLSLLRNTGCIHKAHQSLSGSTDQGIDNIQRIIRAYSESESNRRQRAIKFWENKFILCLDPYHLN